MGQRPARRKCRPRHDADAGCRNPPAEDILNRLPCKEGRKPFGPGYRRKLNEVQLVPHPGGILLQKRFRALHLLHDAGVLPPGKELYALVFQPAAQCPVRAADGNVKDHGLACRVDAMQYLLQPVHQPEISALLKRAVEPEYGPALTVTTADGVRMLAYAEIEYLECTHHIVHFHLITGEDVASLSLRVPFSAVAQPLLADGRFVQPHRSYVVNLEAVQLLAPGEVRMRSGARIPIPRGREAAVREAFCTRAG